MIAYDSPRESHPAAPGRPSRGRPLPPPRRPRAPPCACARAPSVCAQRYHLGQRKWRNHPTSPSPSPRRHGVARLARAGAPAQQCTGTRTVGMPSCACASYHSRLAAWYPAPPSRTPLPPLSVAPPPTPTLSRSPRATSRAHRGLGAGGDAPAGPLLEFAHSNPGG